MAGRWAKWLWDKRSDNKARRVSLVVCVDGIGKRGFRTPRAILLIEDLKVDVNGSTN